MEMKMEFLRKLPAPEELKQQFPVSAQIAEQNGTKKSAGFLKGKTIGCCW